MREIRIFELDGRQAVGWESTEMQPLQVLQGQLWVTIESNLADFWLHAGDSIDLIPGQRVWLGTWTDGARFRISQPLAKRRLRRSFSPFRPTLRGLGPLLSWRRGHAQ